MLKAGISTACLYPQPIEEALYDLALGGVTMVELFINTHSELKRSFVAALSDILHRFEVQCCSLHPFTSEIETMMLFSAYERRLQDYLEYCRYYFTAMQQLGASIFVVHGNKQLVGVDVDFYCERFPFLFGGDAAENGERCKICVGYQTGSAFQRRPDADAENTRQRGCPCAYERPRRIRRLFADWCRTLRRKIIFTDACTA